MPLHKRLAHGSDFVGYLANIPCPNCRNTRKMELHAVYSARSVLWWQHYTYYCLSLNCPVCHHGNSLSPYNVNRATLLQTGACHNTESLMTVRKLEVQLAVTAAYYRTLSQAGKRAYRRMLTQLQFHGLRKALSNGDERDCIELEC